MPRISVAPRAQLDIDDPFDLRADRGRDDVRIAVVEGVGGNDSHESRSPATRRNCRHAATEEPRLWCLRPREHTAP
jgi:hypothetical protein